MHPTDKKVWPIMITIAILFFVFVMLPAAELQQQIDDADTRAWIQKKQEQQRKDEETQRLRDAIRAFNR